MNTKKQSIKLTVLSVLAAVFMLFAVPISANAAGVLYGTNVPTADATANNTVADVIGNKTDAAAADAVSTTESLMAYMKQCVTADLADNILIDSLIAAELADNILIDSLIAAELADNILIDSLIANELLDNVIIDSILEDTGTSIPATITTMQSNVTDILADTATTIPATLAAIPQCVLKADGAVLAALDPIFTITGGPVRCKIVGLVTTVIGGASNGRLQHIVTETAATVDLNFGAVAIAATAGTFYYNVGATSVFTNSAGLGFLLADPVTVEETEFLLAPGVVQFLCDGAQDGVIAWYITYTPLSPLSVVTAAP